MERKYEKINKKLIFKNTLMLYFRHLLIMLVSLFTVRIILKTLGVQDYGIYNVVAGIVVMCSFFVGVMANSCQRYFSFDLGTNNFEHLKKVFNVTFLIYILLALIVLFFAETIGLWFVNNKLVIPTERLVAANWVYQTAVISFLVTLITTPYLALVTSHEDMQVYAYISIIEALLKLLIVFVLVFLSYDKLILYGILLMIVAVINTTLYRSYCIKHYNECRLHFIWDKSLFKEILSFSGWNLWGNISTIIKTQGINILFNVFYGPLVNAAQNVAMQVRGAISTFSNNFANALKPQINKSYAAKQYKELFDLVFEGCKVTYFLILIMIIPLFNNIGYILSLWLVEVPKYTEVFVQLLLLEVLIESICHPMATVNQATGKIALYQTIIGITILLNLPLSYLLLKINMPVSYVYIVSCIIMFFVGIIRLLFLKKIQYFSLVAFIKQVFIPLLFITSLLFLINYFMNLNNNTFLTMSADILAKFLICILVIYIFSTNKEKQYLKKLIFSKLTRKTI